MLTPFSHAGYAWLLHREEAPTGEAARATAYYKLATLLQQRGVSGDAQVPGIPIRAHDKGDGYSKATGHLWDQQKWRPCVGCPKAKVHHRHASPKARDNRAREESGRAFVDLMGPTWVSSLGGEELCHPICGLQLLLAVRTYDTRNVF